MEERFFVKRRVDIYNRGDAPDEAKHEEAVGSFNPEPARGDERKAGFKKRKESPRSTIVVTPTNLEVQDVAEGAEGVPRRARRAHRGPRADEQGPLRVQRRAGRGPASLRRYAGEQGSSGSSRCRC